MLTGVEVGRMGSGRQSVRDPLVPRYGPASAPGPLALVSDAPAGEGFGAASPLARARVRDTRDFGDRRSGECFT